MMNSDKNKQAMVVIFTGITEIDYPHHHREQKLQMPRELLSYIRMDSSGNTGEVDVCSRNAFDPKGIVTDC